MFRFSLSSIALRSYEYFFFLYLSLINIFVFTPFHSFSLLLTPKICNTFSLIDYTFQMKRTYFSLKTEVHFTKNGGTFY
ncbi:hypothetical protein HMPREF0973_01425 [Prevotella veroralis F0319]|uniref:Uncharacterized protein n=1 Tax=Prevotella veroralis F0319 TaxID=649761 RepID=C9MP86_9BACT|nr:hypothetical protein HMPREF0973_01425 [Prevotella veroralis F0319]